MRVRGLKGSSLDAKLDTTNTPELGNSLYVKNEDLLLNAPSLSLSENKDHSEDTKQKVQRKRWTILKHRRFQRWIY